MALALFRLGSVSRARAFGACLARRRPRQFLALLALNGKEQRGCSRVNRISQPSGRADC
jgi:hypothetical protein